MKILQQKERKRFFPPPRIFSKGVSLMFSKLKFASLMFLSCLTIFSVGFASWNISSNSSSTNLSGFIHVDNVINSNEYITFVDIDGNPTTEFDVFDFYKTGFVNKNSEIVDEGILQFYLNVNLKKCFEKFTNASSLLFQIELLCNSNINIFNNSENLGKVVSVEKMNQTESSCNETETVSNDGTSSILSFSLDNTLETVTIKISYRFTIINHEYYKTTLYDAFNRNDFNFSLSTKFSGNESN